MLATLRTPPNRAPRAGVRGLKTRTGGFCRRPPSRAPVFGSQMPKLRRVAKLAATKSASGPSLWPSRDPIGENGGVNLYGYVLNNPINFIDPDGRLAWVPIIIAYIGLTEWLNAPGPEDQTYSGLADDVANLPSIPKINSVKDFAKLGAQKAAKKCKPKSAGNMQQQVERGQAPREVERVDRADPPMAPEPHVHYKDGTSSTQSGGVHDAGNGYPNPSNQTRSWLDANGWTPPPR